MIAGTHIWSIVEQQSNIVKIGGQLTKRTTGRQIMVLTVFCSLTLIFGPKIIASRIEETALEMRSSSDHNDSCSNHRNYSLLLLNPQIIPKPGGWL